MLLALFQKSVKSERKECEKTVKVLHNQHRRITSQVPLVQGRQGKFEGVAFMRNDRKFSAV